MEEYNLSKPPEAGTTIKAFCDCANKETTWAVTIYSPGGGGGKSRLDYSWTCLNCGKNKKIGTWYSAGNQS